MDGLPATLSDTLDVVLTAASGSSKQLSELLGLGRQHYHRFLSSGTMDDLAEAIRLADEAIQVAPASSSNQARALSNGAIYRRARHKHTRSKTDAEEAVRLATEASNFPLQDSSLRAYILGNLGICLKARFNESKAFSDIESAVLATQEAVDLCPSGLQRAKHLMSLGSLLRTKYEDAPTAQAKQSSADIEEAIRHLRICQEITTTTDPEREKSLGLLGSCLYTRYKWSTLDFQDLENAIFVTKMATEGASRAISARRANLACLGRFLAERFSITEEISNINDAIDATQLSISLTPKWDSLLGPRLRDLASHITTRYLRTEALADLDYAIDALWKAFNLTSPEQAERLDTLLKLSTPAKVKFNVTNSTKDLRALVEIHRAIATSDPDKGGFTVLYAVELGKDLRELYLRTGDRTALEEAVSITRDAIRATRDSTAVEQYSRLLKVYMDDLRQVSTEEQAVIAAAKDVVESNAEDTDSKTNFLEGLLLKIQETFSISPSPFGVEEGIRIIQAAIHVVPQAHPIQALLKQHLGHYFEEKYEWTEELPNLDEAIKAFTAAHALDRRPETAIKVMGVLDLKYKTTRTATDLQAAIVFLQEVAETDATRGVTEGQRAYTLGEYLMDRYGKTDRLEDLESAIEFLYQAIKDSSLTAKRRRHAVVCLAAVLNSKYQRTRDLTFLEDAISFAQQAIDISPSKIKRGVPLNTLGLLLRSRFRRTDSMEDLEKAIEVTREAIDNTIGGLLRPSYLSNLADLLVEKFTRTGEMVHLEEAIRVAETSTNSASKDHSLRATHLHGLGHALYIRYMEMEVKLDLDKAIKVMQEATEYTQTDASDQARHLHSLSIYLKTRFRRTGKQEDLDDAILKARAAVDVAPSIAPREGQDLARAMVNLGQTLGEVYSQTRQRHELEQAIKVTQEAVKLSNAGLNRAQAWDRLGLLLSERYKETEDLTDLEEAIKASRAAVVCDLEGSKNSQFFLNLSSHLREKYTKDPTVDHFDEAIDAAEAAVKITPRDHPDRAEMLNNLGSIINDKVFQTNVRDDLPRAILCWEEALYQINAPLAVRMDASVALLQACAVTSEWHRAYKALHTAVEFLPLLTARSHKTEDKQYLLSQAVGLASDAAAAAFNAGQEPHVALRLLEQGRGLLATSLDELRADISLLRRKHPNLAEEFARLQQELRPQTSGGRRTSTMDEPHSALRVRTSLAYRADRDFDHLLADIRSQPDFADFLLPLGIHDMKAAAGSGPVVIVNVSEHRCDAILVEVERIRALELPLLTAHDIQENTRKGDLGSPRVLGWLWDVVAKPVLDALGYTCAPSTERWPHVWWIPTGSLSRLPLHASGRHRKGSTEAVLERVMSSYSSSLKAIVTGRRRPVPTALARPKPAQALLVAIKTTSAEPSLPYLVYADTEVAELRTICRAVPAHPVEPGPRRNDIIAQLPHCDIFHFAGHGTTDMHDPSQSHLVAYDGTITVETLLELDLRGQPPFMAYLSACGTGRIQDDRFLDESIHLISACQLSGFRHVVGTLWNVQDASCVEVARMTYQRLRDGGLVDESVCLGLHNALRSLRRDWLDKKAIDEYSRGRHTGSLLTGLKVQAREGGGQGWDLGTDRDAEGLSEDEYDDENNDNNGEDGVNFPRWVPFVHFGV
ncbi:CHAT domain-containing protein [Xylariomycetidae sp. FL0641]|nr:CHAT domain-containing protein [Xylariomycetidae sp. FL0641]